MSTRRVFLCTAAAAFGRDGLRVSDLKRQKLTVTYGPTTLLEYRYTNERPKPYVHPLCLADGTPITLDGPKDHVHHRGLMVGWSEVNGIDFWGETNPARHGQIVHQTFERISESPVVEVVSRNHWVAEGRLLLVERRTLRVPPPSAGGVWLEWITELHAPHETVQLAAGEHVYNGLGARMISSMDGGSVLNANGTTEIAKANGDAARWCAYHHGGAGLAMFDHPRNPRHPNAFFVMNKDFGYLSAAPTFRGPFDLAVNQPIRFHWGVLAFRGEADAALLDGRFHTWSRPGQ
jgi:hypothetical protein